MMIMTASQKTPMVSVLLAARNEEANIVRCLTALDRLDFPKAQFEVLIGDDQSTDATPELILSFISNKPHFRYQRIESQTPGLRGKANVLAQLAHLANGKYFFYCDADIAVAPTWLDAMLRLFGAKTGVVVGVTRMTSIGGFAAMQSLEWLFSIAAMRFFSFLKIPFTGMGNNMVVRREAYFAVGGYEGIGFSIVEDFALFVAIIEKGHDFRQGFQPQILSISEPTRTVAELLVQRKRWVKGAMQAPWPIKLSFFASALLLPILLILLFVSPGIAIGLAALHYALVTTIAVCSITILGQTDLYRYVLLFWFYFNLNNTLMLINYLRPTETIWKGRAY